MHTCTHMYTHAYAHAHNWTCLCACMQALRAQRQRGPQLHCLRALPAQLAVPPLVILSALLAALLPALFCALALVRPLPRDCLLQAGKALGGMSRGKVRGVVPWPACRVGAPICAPQAVCQPAGSVHPTHTPGVRPRTAPQSAVRWSCLHELRCAASVSLAAPPLPCFHAGPCAAESTNLIQQCKCTALHHCKGMLLQ